MNKILELETELNRLKKVKEIKDSIDELQKKIKPTTDLILKLEKVLLELETIGWRAVLYGDEYNYGGYSNYLYSVYGLNAKEKAEKAVASARDGGCVERIIAGKEQLARVVY
jgi:hypothetical protein